MSVRGSLRRKSPADDECEEYTIVEISSDQKKANLQNERAGRIPGSIILKKKDTPLASPGDIPESYR